MACRRAACLVCKRWRRVFLGTPAIWRTFCLTSGSLNELKEASERGAWLAAKQRLLRTLAGCVVEFLLHDPTGIVAAAMNESSTYDAASFVPALQPEALERFTWSSCLPLPGPALVALAAHTGLQSLSIMSSCRLKVCHLGSGALGPTDLPNTELAGLLCTLRPTLRRLELDVRPWRCEAPALGPVADAVLGLTGLTCLHFVNMRGGLALDLIRLPQLADLKLESSHDAEGPMRLPALSQLALTSLQLNIQDLQLPGCSLLRCDLEYRTGSLHLNRVLPADAPLEPLLAALLPAGSPLTRLQLGALPATPGAVQGCTQLTQLCSLVVKYYSLDVADPVAVAAALLQQAPALQNLATN